MVLHSAWHEAQMSGQGIKEILQLRKRINASSLSELEAHERLKSRDVRAW